MNRLPETGVNGVLERQSELMHTVGALVVGNLLKPLTSVTVEGAEHLHETGGAILLANHRSLADTVQLPLVARAEGIRLFQMSKSTVREWPFLGWYASKTGAYFVARGRDWGKHRLTRDETKESVRIAYNIQEELTRLGHKTALYVDPTRRGEAAFTPNKNIIAQLAQYDGIAMIPTQIYRNSGALRHQLHVRFFAPFTPQGTVEEKAAGIERILQGTVGQF